MWWPSARKQNFSLWALCVHWDSQTSEKWIREKKCSFHSGWDKVKRISGATFPGGLKPPTFGLPHVMTREIENLAEIRPSRSGFPHQGWFDPDLEGFLTYQAERAFPQKSGIPGESPPGSTENLTGLGLDTPKKLPKTKRKKKRKTHNCKIRYWWSSNTFVSLFTTKHETVFSV